MAESGQPPSPTKRTRQSGQPSSPTERTRRSSDSQSDGDGSHSSTSPVEHQDHQHAVAPPLPNEPLPPPLPNEPVPAAAEPQAQEDDGWEPVWEDTYQAWYFYNRFTGTSQWENPRVPEASSVPAASSSNVSATVNTGAAGGYNPAIHGNYDPNADYAKVVLPSNDSHTIPNVNDPQNGRFDPGVDYAATAQFNRFTGRFQANDLAPEKFNDENKSHRQMNAFFDVDAAANRHDGRSLKAERQNRKLTKKEVQEFREKRREKKEEKRKAWLRD